MHSAICDKYSLQFEMILHAFWAPGPVLAPVKGFLERADNLDLSHPSARNLRHPSETGRPMPKTDKHTKYKTTIQNTEENI